jgi:outer membrane protein OmpA-like peptidoglycan-associated protein
MKHLRATLCVGALGMLIAPEDAAAAYDDPDAPATVQAAEAAVGRLGAERGRSIGGRVTAISGRIVAIRGAVLGTGSASREVKASVKDLEAAKRDLAAKETEIEVRVDLPADVLFDVDKADIRSDASQALAHLATLIRAYSGPVKLTGHTDSDGSDEHNLKLSIRRAESVKAWLGARENIDPARVQTAGMGEAKPIALNDSAANKQRNRRVEVVIRKQ